MEGPRDAYCCAGCEMAAAIISGAGLDAYYVTRTAPAPQPVPAPADWRAVAVTHDADGLARCHLTIEGLRCASCVWVVEGVLARTAGMHRAHVSYATGRSTLVFDPEVVGLDDIGARIAALGYRPRPVEAIQTVDRDLLARLGVAAFCTANVMLLSATVYTGWFEGMAPRYVTLFRWSQLVLASPVALWSAAPFFGAAWTGLRNRILHMDLPISLAVGSLYVHGVAATWVGTDGYLDSLTMLVTLLLGGRVLEARGRRDAADAAACLAATLPATARRCTPDGVETVSTEALRPGDRIEVGLGEEIGGDGVVVMGTAQIRMALLTGETDPIPVGPGDRVVAGAPVVLGAVTVAVDRVGTDTLGQRMAAEVLASVDRGLPPTPADRLAPGFTAITLTAAALAFAGWTAAAGPARGIEVMASVLVVACPCALGLSWPVAVSAGLAAVARRGLLLRDGATLIRLADVDVIALDKTGTLTAGVPRVIAADDTVLRIAAGLERASHHPVAQALRAAAADRGLPLPLPTDVVETPGIGIRGTVDGRAWQLRSGGPGEVDLVGIDGVTGSIRLADTPRGDAPVIVGGLRAVADVHVLTGDHGEAAAPIARGVGIQSVHARMTPHDKAAWVRDREAAGHRVLFVGDGLNDGPALVAAHVGIAMGSGVTAALKAADGVITSDALGPLAAGLAGARVVRRVVRANLARSLGYNSVALTFAMAGWVDPLVAAVLMPLSSLWVLYGGSKVEALLAEEDSWTSS